MYKVKGVNLLGGRVRIRTLHPFIYKELKEEFDLRRALDIGLLPPIYFSDSPYDDLESYAGNYLKEEIAAEAIVRNIHAFSRFLIIAALSNGQIINYSNISSDAQVPKSTVQEYFQILKDTLIGFELPAWKKTIKRKPLSTSKFYFFDIGVVRFLQKRRGLQKGSPEFGNAFESYIFHELRAYIDYQSRGTLHYWRSTSGLEVDFILHDNIAIEVKAKVNIGRHDLKNLFYLKEETNFKYYLLVCLEKVPRYIQGITILPWNIFLEKLWYNDFLDK